MDGIAKIKILLLIILGCSAIVHGVFSVLFTSASSAAIVFTVFMLLGVTISYVWYHYDAIQMRYSRSAWLNILIIAIGILAFPYYFFRTRGFSKGFVYTLSFLLIVMTLGFLQVTGAYAARIGPTLYHTSERSLKTVMTRKVIKYSPSKNKLVQWLAQGKFSELEHQLNLVQARYEKGDVDGLSLFSAYLGFEDTDPALAPKFTDWIKAYPKSYPAHLAEGIYYIHVGRKARGYDYINKVSYSQLATLHAALSKAQKDLLLSLKLDNKPILSYYWLIDITRYGSYNDYAPNMNVISSNPVIRSFLYVINKIFHQKFLPKVKPLSQRDLFNAAIRLAPQSFIIRRKYMSALETRWGHSTGEMIEFLNQCRKAKLSSAKMGELQAQVDRDRAWNANNEGDIASAASEYAAASDLIKGHEALYDKRLAAALYDTTGYCYEKLNRYVLSKKYYKICVQIDPADSYAWYGLGYSRMRLKNMPGAAQGFQKAAELGDPIGEDEWGTCLWYGSGVPKNQMAAIEWFKKAAAKGNKDAKKNLYWSELKIKRYH